MAQVVNKTVNLNLIGLDGNAFALMGAFQRQARREGWTADEIKAVLDEARSGDYNHLLVTLDSHCEPEDEDFEDQEEEDEWDDNDEDFDDEDEVDDE